MRERGETWLFGFRICLSRGVKDGKVVRVRRREVAGRKD